MLHHKQPVKRTVSGMVLGLPLMQVIELASLFGQILHHKLFIRCKGRSIFMIQKHLLCKYTRCKRYTHHVTIPHEVICAHIGFTILLKHRNDADTTNINVMTAHGHFHQERTCVWHGAWRGTYCQGRSAQAAPEGSSVPFQEISRASQGARRLLLGS